MRAFLVLISAFFAFPVLAAKGGGGGTAGAAGAPREPVAIVLAHDIHGAGADELQRQTDRFNAAQKDFRIQLRHGADAWRGAHLFLMSHADLSRHGGTRLVRPVHQLLSGKEAKSAIPAPLQPVASDDHGNLIALPYAFSAPLLYVDRAAFRRAGLDPERAPRTWAEVQAAADRLQDAGYACPYTSSWPVWVHIENLSAMHDEPLTRGNALAINGLVQVKHIARMASWHKSSFFRYFGRRDEADAHFISGECAMITGSSNLAAALQAAGRDDVALAPLPHYDDVEAGTRRSLPQGEALWVAAGHKPAEYRGVTRVLAFFMESQAQAEWPQRTGYLPLRAAREGDRPGFAIALRQLGDRGAALYQRGMRLFEREGVRDIVAEELEKVWDNTIPAKEALDRAVMRGNALLHAPARLAALPR